MHSQFIAQLTARLVTMHAYCRPAGSIAERTFIERYLVPLGATADAYRNYHVIVGTSAASTSVLWSCHTDTVHHTSGSQRVRLVDGRLTARRSSCLGADDTAGVFLCAELIRLGVPGHYIFHYGEERGCIGSQSLADAAPDWLSDVKYAIALDRAGYCDVISHQMGRRTASDAFCQALGAALSSYDSAIAALAYVPCPNGVYTDTESYAELVPECSNLSVGYHGAHGSAESLHVPHVLALLDALAHLDVTALPCDRNPEEYDDRFALPSWYLGDDDAHGTYNVPLWSTAPRSPRDRLFDLCKVRDREPIGRRRYPTTPYAWRDRTSVHDCGPIFADDGAADDDVVDVPDVPARHPYLDDTFALVQAELQARLRNRGKL